MASYPVAEPAPERTEEAVGSVPEAVDETNVGRREVERTDDLQHLKEIYRTGSRDCRIFFFLTCALISLSALYSRRI